MIHDHYDVLFWHQHNSLRSKNTPKMVLIFWHHWYSKNYDFFPPLEWEPQLIIIVCRADYIGTFIEVLFEAQVTLELHVGFGYHGNQISAILTRVWHGSKAGVFDILHM